MKRAGTISPDRKATTPARPAQPTTAAPINPTLAQALFAVASGDPAVVISSPPGAGKTHLITHLANQLTTRLNMRVAIAGQTRAQALDVANRTAQTGAVTHLVTSNGKQPSGAHPDLRITTNRRLASRDGVVVTTTARWQWIDPTNYHADVLLIDEAYQLTYADLGSLGTLGDQVALVGDPGQISPVVTGSTRRWAAMETGPHQPAPAALIASHGNAITQLTLPHTYRLGPATTDLITPLYPTLDFTSARPPSHLTDTTGATLSEYTSSTIDLPAGRTDSALAVHARTVTDDLLSANHHDNTGDQPMTPSDLAVIAPHVEQTALIAAALSDLPDVFVGTINQAQGLERRAVIAIHPLAGYRTAPDFATDLGRLCVALSRHRSHLHVITDPLTPDVLAREHREHTDNHALAVQRTILDTLTTQADPR